MNILSPYFNFIFSILIVLLIPCCLDSQAVSINTSGNNPDPNAILDIQSDSKGILIPRMNSTQRGMINPAPVGLLVFDTETKSFWFNDGTNWIELISGKIKSLSDDDGDTKIQVEEGVNDNTIRFDVMGDEAMVLQPDGNLEIKGNQPNDAGFMSLRNSDNSQFLRLFGGRLIDPSPYLMWRTGSDLRLVTANLDFSGFGELMRLQGDGDVGIGVPDALTKLHVSGGLLLEGISGPIPVSGAGTRLMWVPSLSGFRTGLVTGDQWDSPNFGERSAAVGGTDNIAKSINSFVGGGSGNKAEGTSSAILGGGGNIATGASSTAVGGAFNKATGFGTYAFGFDSKARSAFETVFGHFNTEYTPISTTTLEPNDRLFVIGNGTISQQSDALIIYKNGNMEVGGKISNVTDPMDDQDAATKIYIDNVLIQFGLSLGTTGSIRALRDAGYSIQELIDSGSSILALWNLGITISEFFNEGFTIQDLLNGGVTYLQILNAGTTLQDFIDDGFTLQDLLNGGVTLQDILDAGGVVDVFELLDNGAMVLDLYGLIYQEGIIFHVDEMSNSGLICSQFNLGTFRGGGIGGPASFGEYWGCNGTFTGATGVALGTGVSNTMTIVNDPCSINDFITQAAEICDSYDSGSFTDWYLPSEDELLLIYNNIGGMGGFGTAYSSYYWSSTEVDANNAIAIDFSNGMITSVFKSSFETFRAIRAF